MKSKMYTRTVFFMLLLSGGTFFAQAQDLQVGKTHQFTLKECLDYALEHQDSMKNARLDVESASYKVKETIGIGLPQIDGTAKFQDFVKIPTTLFPDFITPLTYGVLENEGVRNGNGDPIKTPDGAGGLTPVKFGAKYQSSADITVSQLIFNGSYLVGLKASKTYKELSEKNLNRTKIQTQVSVTKAYYQVLVNAEQIKLLDANINQLKSQLNETTQLNKQGFVEKVDLDRIQVLYNNLTTTRENTVRMLALGYQLLKFQMGMPVTETLLIKDKIENIKLDEAIELTADSVAYKNRIEYGLLETQKKLNDLNLQRVKSQYLPSLVAFGNASYQYQSNRLANLFDQRFPTTVIGLQLNVPIFSGFQRLNQARQAKIEVKKSENTLNLVKNAIMLEQEVARTTYQNSLQSLNNQKSNMALANEVLRVSKIKYEQGVGSSIEVTQAQTALEGAENNYIQALYDALISKVDLDKAYGHIQ